ncbi:K02A2.6-like [Cordylochernes scorpioides]|uniref:RNA-directed DNA polymerase n=1 Tax=Cordylochernes scorpioides TaxID=51811 RepID=A0ABY6KLI3_9ARAC|nr:K02A2.6-like [Cordylochernes scorpioides]
MENSVQVPKFDGKNFASWKFRIVSILEGKELDDLLERDPPEDEVKFKEWKKKDAQAKGIITCAMTDSLVALILNCKTSKDIWIALHERYEGDKKKRIIEARNDVSRLTMKKEENWEEYLYRSEKLLEQARNLGAEIEDQEFTTSVIRGLPQKYNLVALQLNSQMKVSISDLKNCLKLYHERFTHEEKEGNSKAFNTMHKESFSNNKHFHKNRNSNKPICFICAKPGHKAIECWHNPKNKRASENKQTSKNKPEHQNKAKFVNLQPEEHVSNIKENETTQQPEEWVVDSGASCHMTSNRDLLKEEREVHKTIKLADDSEIISNAEGAIEIEGQNKLIRLNDVLYVEKLSGNLMSVNKLVDDNKKVLFDKDGGHIMEEDGEDILIAQRINDFYIIKTSAPEEIPSQALKATLHTWNDWHKRLGHLNEEYMKQMLKNNSAHNFNTQSQNMDTCQVCIQAKHPRTPFKPVLYPQSTRPLDLIHIDLIGPIQEESIGGAKYVLTLVDDFSRKIFVEFLSSKLETFDIIRSFIEEIEKEKEIKVKQLRSDNGKEFTNNQMTQYLKATEIDKKSIPRQRAILLYNIGELALDIYSTFKIQETDASPTVPDILELFDGHFKPYKNTTYKRYQFFTTEQGENQNFDDYVTELKNKSMDCEFGELADSLVRDRIIIGIKDKALKERMLQDPDLSLAKAIDLGRATETSRQQVKNITREDVDLHSIKYKKQYKKNFKYPVGRKPNVSEEHPNAKVCQNCGSRHPYGKCFAYGKICNSCKKPNHFAKMCRNRVHMLEERAEEEEEMCLQYLSLDSITGLEWTKIILVENNSVNFKLDTGAQVNILPLDTIKNWQNKPCIYPTGIAVYSYTGEKVPIRGKCKASCTSGKKSEILEFLVVDLPAPPILGLAACKKLELILKVESLEQDHTRTKMDASPTKIIESYRDVFDEIGTLPGEHSVILRENAHPRIQLARRIPFALKKPVEMELKSMEEQKIISKVDQPAEWAHPMVIIKKPNGKVRICMDPRELNPWIKMEYRQLPAPEGIIADITKSPIYTVLDAKSAFWQIKLDEKSSSLLTMATPYGYYRFHRLPFGICSAPEVFYKKMQSMFTGIEGVKVYMDDIIIYGNSLTEHNSRLITVLEIARKNNLKFEFNKMQLAQEKVKFIGHEISKNGISADPSKLEAIQKIKRPMDKTSLQRFLGTVNYLAKFMHNLADKTVLLRQLLKKNTLWTWNEAIEKEFIELKNLVSNPPVLGLFDPHRKVTLSVGASQHGLGAVLMQEGRPIAFASASLNNTQKKYAQIEKELLALWYGCQRFNYHLYGRKFTAQTDHKPLLAILKKPLEELSPRLERLVLKLMRYDFNLEYVPGKVIHTADTLSRDSISEETIDTSDLDLQNTIMTLNLKVTTKRYQEILRDMESDEEMIKLRDHILNGWPIHKKSVDYAVKPYWHCKEELYIWKDLICRGQRLVIPKVQRESILQTLHMSHQGISACKNRAHEAIYWPGLDREIEEMVYKCRICQESQPSQRKEPLIPHEIADYPWQKVAIDFFYLDQSVFIIIVDYYSSFPEVIKVASTSAKRFYQF